MRISRELDVNASLRMLYEQDDEYDILSEQLHEIPDAIYEESPDHYLFKNHHDIILVRSREYSEYHNLQGPDETIIKWVATGPDFGCVSQSTATCYNNKPEIEKIYGHVCLIMTLGPHGDRSNIDQVVEKILENSEKARRRYHYRY